MLFHGIIIFTFHLLSRSLALVPIRYGATLVWALNENSYELLSRRT